MDLCQYKDMFGVAGSPDRLREHVFGMTVVDWFVMLVACVLIQSQVDLPLATIVFMMFVMSVVAHRAFCVRTTVDKFLFPDA